MDDVPDRGISVVVSRAPLIEIVGPCEGPGAGNRGAGYRTPAPRRRHRGVSGGTWSAWLCGSADAREHTAALITPGPARVT